MAVLIYEGIVTVPIAHYIRIIKNKKKRNEYPTMPKIRNAIKGDFLRRFLAHANFVARHRRKVGKTKSLAIHPSFLDDFVG